MRRNRWVLVSVMMAACSPVPGAPPSGSTAQGIVAGAGYTTFDADQGGCKDSPNGVNCNNYEKKQDVFLTGGPVKAGLSNGTYFFAVLVPGYQNGGFIDGAKGNLSDTNAEKGCKEGDTAAERTFTVTDHEITYDGPHGKGTTPNGRSAIQLVPFCDTWNNGGVYILAICQVGATSPKQCKFDAFKVKKGKEPPPWPHISGMKYYDSNANGQHDDGEPGIAGWPIDLTDKATGLTDAVVTRDDGTFAVDVVAGAYGLAEQQVVGWVQTGNIPSANQTAITGNASAVLNADMTYDVSVSDGSTVAGVYFGNVCVGPGGGHTPGFWSNQNGQALLDAADMAALSALCLRDANGDDFDPSLADYDGYRSWLLGSNAVNMAYKLSSHLAAMKLNVLNGLVDGAAMIYAPGVAGASSAGFVAVSDVMDQANASLCSSGRTTEGSVARAEQALLKDALDRANNNQSFLQPGPDSCPAIPAL